jgi:hypothetical protein
MLPVMEAGKEAAPRVNQFCDRQEELARWTFSCCSQDRNRGQKIGIDKRRTIP